MLSQPAKALSFPLDAEDMRDVQILEQQFDQEQNCSGLAAPQIGISKQIIVFAAPDDQNLKKWRPDFTQAMPKTIWINPTYEGIEADGFHEDYEACFSVKEMAAPVKRYKKVKYHAFDIHGQEVSGVAEGFVARIIQHEIDHVQGKLFIDYADPETILPIETYRAMRKAAMESKEGRSK
jgi:peptide deformylase